MDPLTTLCLVGAVGDLSDGQLLRRFLTAEGATSQAAFAALVDRHGPMVLRTVRRILGDTHDAEDVFQATFLLLARKASSVREAESVAGWLHGVARRVAVRARIAADRRKLHERQSAARAGAGPNPDRGPIESWDELHEEIAGLPRRYREAIVLCYLEGLTTEVAARRLGCPQGTVMSRLARGRERLRARLSRRGLGQEMANSAPAALVGVDAIPAALRSATVAASSSFANAPGIGAAAISITAKNLATGELHAMNLSNLKMIAFAMMIGAVGLGGAKTFGWIESSGRGGGGAEPPPKVAAAGQPAVAADRPKEDIKKAPAQGPPLVVESSIDDGEEGVDPKTTELRVTFDRDMGRGMSVVGGGPTFPVDPKARPRWLNARTIVIPLKLEPGRNYDLSLNNKRFQNFKSTGGDPAAPHPIQFTTGGGRAPSAPRVVKSSIEDGAGEISPKTSELRVTFDQDMDRGGGMSVVGSGPTFPVDPLTRPHWSDARTIVIPLKLEPNRGYELGINGEKFRNFRSAKGRSSVPYSIRFKTAR